MCNKLEKNVQKNQKYIVNIEDFGSNGEGIAKIDGFTVFVPNAIVGETVEIIIILVKSTFAIGKVTNIIERSEYRVDAPCKYFGKCGGCQLQHMTYDKQLEYKKKYIENCLKKYAKVDACVSRCVESKKEYAYRNKFAFPVAKIDDKVVVGMYRINSHNLVEIENCLIQDNCKDAIEIFTNWANKYNVSVFFGAEKEGIRHIVARIDGNNIIFIVVSTKKLQNLEILYQNLCKKYNVIGLINNINTKNNNVIMGDVDHVVFGKNQLEFDEFGIKYNINSHSFLQVNTFVKEMLYKSVLENISGDDIVIDAYSGAGVLTAMMSKKCKYAYGIEIVKQATENANNLMVQNKIDNMKNICGDCAVELPKLIQNINSSVVVLDPPRKGCDRTVISAINDALPEKIIYISCNPATLARDVALLTNYKICDVIAFDMFPQTANVETLLILKKMA